MIEHGGFVKKIEFINKNDEYPFSIPSIKNIEEIELNRSITYFVGENGSGKSTILEAIAGAVGINPEGGNKNTRFSLLNTESSLQSHIRLVKTTKKIKSTYFPRSETNFNLFIAAQKDLDEHAHWSWSHHGYGQLKNRSHGESHLDIIQNKMESGFYLFDEPEAGLSIEKQLQFIAELQRLLNGGSQIVIATHSAIILSHPDSIIYELGEHGAAKVDYKNSKVWKMTEMFVKNRDRMISELLK
jgi:predicted ATPase